MARKSKAPVRRQPPIRVAGEDMELVRVALKDLDESEYNPRSLSAHDEQALRESLDVYGYVDPLIVNSSPERMHIVIGGHQRLRLLREVGYTHAMVLPLQLSEADEKDLNLRLNRNRGEWDFSKLQEYSSREAMEVAGFLDSELVKAFPERPDSAEVLGASSPKSKTAPVGLDFSPDFDSTADYLFVKVTDSAVMEALEDALGLEPVRSRTGRYKGVMRICDGAQLLEVLNG